MNSETPAHHTTLSSISNLYMGVCQPGGAVVLCAKKCKSKRNDAKDLLGCHESKDFVRQEQRKVLKAISYTPETQKRVLGQILTIYELVCKNSFSSSVRSQ